MAYRKKLKNNRIATVGGDEIAFMKSILNPVHIWLSMAVQNGIAIFTKDENAQKVYIITGKAIICW